MRQSDFVSMRERNIIQAERLMIATPIYNGAQADFVRSRDAAVTTLIELGFKVALAYVVGDSLLTHARNSAAAQFLESGFDHLMMIDADMGFGIEAIPRLLHARKELVCGTAPQKRINWDAVRDAVQRGEKDLEACSGIFTVNTLKRTAVTADEPIMEIKNGGTGFMLIKRVVFEKLRESATRMREVDDTVLHDFFTEGMDETGLYLSEDHNFCQKWRNAGGRVYLDAFLRLTHTGSYVFRGDISKGTDNLGVAYNGNEAEVLLSVLEENAVMPLMQEVIGWRAKEVARLAAIEDEKQAMVEFEKQVLKQVAKA